MTKPIIQGLYAITNAATNEERLFEHVSAAIRGGAKFIQYRDKSNDKQRQQRIGHRLLMLCKEYEACLIINDDVSLCQTLGADGVHLGQDDIALNTARQQLGDEKIIGVSCYNQLQLAVQAQQESADYVAFGSFFNSSTKPDAVNAPITLLNDAKTHLHLPIVAIGGITVDNAKTLIDAGADALALVNGLFATNDVEAKAQIFSNYWQDNTL